MDPQYANFATSALGDLMITEAYGPSPPEAVAWLEQQAVAFGTARPGRAVYLHCIGPGVKNELPGEATRKAMVSFVRNASKAFTGAALLLEIPGFAGSAFRSMFSGVFFVARIELPLKIHGDAGSALKWLGEQSQASAIPDMDAVLRERARLLALR